MKNERTEWEAKVIAEAVAWTAFQWRGPRNRVRRDAETEAEAAALGAALLEEHPARGVMLYATNAKGNSVHVRNL